MSSRARALDLAHGGGLFAAVATGPVWMLEGSVCPACGQGALRMAHPSEPCARPPGTSEACDACGAAKGGVCAERAEGFADCTACDVPQQVWPADMLAPALAGELADVPAAGMPEVVPTVPAVHVQAAGDVVE